MSVCVCVSHSYLHFSQTSSAMSQQPSDQVIMAAPQNSETENGPSSAVVVAAAPAPAAESPPVERIKATRHPRWTRQETLVLIESKKLVENGEHGGYHRFRSPASSSGLVSPHHGDHKWDLVSSLCQQHGVKRGAVQCRKRWGNLLTDFRKIKKWETSIKEETESFWIMRNDLRKEKKLPGFFDAVVYNVLDGGVCTVGAFPLTLVKMSEGKTEKTGHGVEGVGAEQGEEEEGEEGEEEEDEAIVDSEKMGWSTEEENFETNSNGVRVSGQVKTPIPRRTRMRGGLQFTPTFTLPNSGYHGEPVQEGPKRRRISPENSEDDIVKVMRRNSDILKAHLGAQNMNQQLAREQQKQQTESLVATLGKLADALTKIADKL
ncbi:trihelix transcription factor ASR3-like [Lotus japonicus]|uniref:trihelix transcription factor ASR3-like n=1 Tax=Lotus japonicus TaxID=34305 RepID=UPI0025901BF6|nr:trihelix transcription factor ASR3-like [Lotus japonicus]